MAFLSFSKSASGIAFLLVSVLASTVLGYHKHINDNYMLDVELSKDNKTIEFRIQAINVTGWVGVGVNDHGKDMVGGDLFIGGVNAGESYGWDYHVPTNGTNGVPERDLVNNWNYNITEVNGTTNVVASRLLKTSDNQNDTEITDKFTNLLWAYHLTNDSLVQQHTKQGSYAMNIITGAENKESGANIVSVCWGILHMGLVAAVLKY